MAEWGTVRTSMGGGSAVISVVAYVRSLSEPARIGDYLAVQGQRLYEGVCIACHGVDGTGNQALGAPDLTDDYWMYGDSTAQLTESIARGRHGVMPPWRDMLGETSSRLVGAYVWPLSHPGGETATPAAQATARPRPFSPTPLSTPPPARCHTGAPRS